eukprot:sb/3478451/
MISLAIVLTGLITVLPDSLMMTLGVTLGYQAANIFTVTLYYVNSICNPCIYFCSNTLAQDDMSQMPGARKISMMVLGERKSSMFSSSDVNSPNLDRISEL